MSVSQISLLDIYQGTASRVWKGSVHTLVHSSTVHKSGGDHHLVNKIKYIHTMENYLAIKRKESLTPATTWMNLENTVLNEMSQ
jgi:hypothetical protein